MRKSEKRLFDEVVQKILDYQLENPHSTQIEVLTKIIEEARYKQKLHIEKGFKFNVDDYLLSIFSDSGERGLEIIKLITPAIINYNQPFSLTVNK